MAPVLDTPSSGIPSLINTSEAFLEAAEALSQGQGPIAIDTERASGFRYDDRAFLVQVRRRGVGTLLFAPEGHRSEFSAALSPVVNGQDWVVHAASSDLPSLAWLGLYPGTLFDTEVAGRLAGFDHVNLAAMIEEVFDVRLKKGHGAEDWSQVPLPQNWLSYAALDVELLLELAEAVAELLDAQDKLEWASEEFEYIRKIHADIDEPITPTWRSAKGVTTLHRPEQLAVARELWLARESIAVENDRAVSRILPNKTLVEIARILPTAPSALAGIRGFPTRRKSSAMFWFQIITRARASNQTTWPRRERRPRGTPSHQTWAKEFPEVYERLTTIRELIDELSIELSIPTENLLRPATLRAAVWAAVEGGSVRTTDELIEFLHDHDARRWQIDMMIPVMAPMLFS